MALEGGTVVIDVQARWKGGLSPGIDAADKKVDKFTASIEEAENELSMLGRKKTKLDVDDRATGKVNKFLQTTKQFAGKTFTSTVKIVDYATRPLQAIKNSLFSIKGLVAGVMGGMAFNAGVLNPISIADRDTNSEVFFETLLGEGKGAAFVKKIEGMAKSSTMDYDASMSAVQSMLGMGWNQDTVLSDLQVLIDTTAALGGGADKLSGIALALSQIKSKGKLSTEELNQLAERGVNAKGILAEQLGYGSGDAALMKLSKDLEKGNIGADAAIEALMEGLESSYSGLDAELARTSASGIVGQIKDTFKIDVVKRWGKGIQEGAVRSLGSMLDLMEENDDLIVKLGDSLYKLGSSLSNTFADGVEKTSKRLLKVLKSPEFENASLGEKISIVWDEVVAKPFSEWWDGGGKKMIEEKAGQIGSGIGKGITNGLLALLGIDVVGATGDGVDIGKAFTDGFIDGIDTGAIAEALANAFKDAAKDALKVLPGGDNPTTGSWISALLLGFVGKKMGLGKLLGKAGSKLTGGSLFKGVSSDDLGYLAWLAKNANPAGKTDWLSKLSGAGSWLGGLGSKIGGSKAAGFMKGNWLSLLFAGGAIASADNKWYEAGRQGTGILGGAYGGKMGSLIGGSIGTAIMPGAGTAIGAGVGGFAGSVLGYLGGDKAFTAVDWSAIGDKFTQTADNIGKNFDAVQGQIKTELIDPAGAFFTETLPSWWDEKIAGPFSEACASFKTTIDSISTWFSEKSTAISGWFEEKQEAVSNWFSDKFTKHATGGIFGSPHLGLVAEDGPEAIIPLGAKRRQRGIDLWKRAGAAMGVTAYADGGIIGAGSGGGISVGGVTVHITVDGGSGTLVEALENQSEEIKEAIAGILYDALSSSFNNRPVTA